MSLSRKDVKFWLDPEYHVALREICDMRGVTLGEFVERLVVSEVARVSAASVPATALSNSSRQQVA